MSELAFSYRRGGLHFPALRLWLDASTAIGPSEGVCVSHAHSDHTGAHKSVIFSGPTQKLMRVRVAGKRQETALEYGVARRLAGLEPHPENCQTQMTLLPAGHILGSAMVFLEAEQGSLLYTGDFKLRRGLSAEACQRSGCLDYGNDFRSSAVRFSAVGDGLVGCHSFLSRGAGQ
jgi:Cft2 family RNA processing exonuclease